MRVLIVDDSKAMRMMVRRVVSQASDRGATFTEAADGQEALAAIRADVPDLVLSDWNMPEMNGIELLQALNDEGITVPFGFVTSESSKEMKKLALDAGARFMICKPFTPAAFDAALRAVNLS
jgi:two-component system chemotaxis response regulator CheY